MGLRQVLVNNVANAMKCTTGKTVFIYVQCVPHDASLATDEQPRRSPEKSAGGESTWVNSRHSGPMPTHDVKISVSDAGPGLSEKDRLRVWEPYYRGVDAGAADGSGLGLAVVKLLAGTAGWTCGVEDSQMGGSRFWVRLPLLSTTPLSS